MIKIIFLLGLVTLATSQLFQPTLNNRIKRQYGGQQEPQKSQNYKEIEKLPNYGSNYGHSHSNQQQNYKPAYIPQINQQRQPSYGGNIQFGYQPQKQQSFGQSYGQTGQREQGFGQNNKEQFGQSFSGFDSYSQAPIVPQGGPLTPPKQTIHSGGGGYGR